MVGKKSGFRSILATISISILLVLLLMPFASAKITILNNFKDMYNLGDTVTVDGYVVAATTADAMFSLELQCPGYSKVNSVNLKINKGQKVTFTSLGISSFLLPSDIEGVCDVEATFNGESANSDSFTVLNDLLGSFEVGADTYQLGDTMTLSGIVFKLDGSDVSGTATIYLKKQGSYPTQLDTATVTNGALSYSKQLSNLEYGTYYIDVKVIDGVGNSQYFENVDYFTINTLLTIRASSSKYQYEPGEEVVISGDIDSSVDTSTLDVVITFDTLRYTTKPSGQNFEYRFFVPKNMKSGDYTLGVSVSDSYGNTGSDDFILTVKQIPTKIVNDMSKTSYNPGETLSFEVDLFDQSDKSMSASVSVKITDPSGATLYNGVVNTGQQIELEFGKYSTPGTYVITSTYTAKNLEDTDRVTVASVSGVSSSLDGEKITIVNDGNVPYDDRVDLILVKEEDGKKYYYVLAKDVALEPGKEQTFDLSYDVPEGQYTILVDDGETDLSSLEDAELADYVSGLESMTGAAVYSDVPFSDDNRPFGTKVDQGLSTVTGATTLSSYDRSVTPWFLLLILFIFGGLLGLYGYQHRTVIQQAYENYKKKIKQKAEEEGGFLSTMKHEGAEESNDGDISEDQVAQLLASQGVSAAVSKTEEVVAKPAPARVTAKPGTPTIMFDTAARQTTSTTVGAARYGENKFSTFGKSPQALAQPKPTLKKPVMEAKIDPMTGKKINRFSTWSPPSTAGLDEKSFPAKNPVKEPSALEKEKEKAVYDDIDEDFLRDEKF